MTAVKISAELNSSMKQKIFVSLHCESCYNRDGIFCGRTDSLLTDTGHKHATKLAKKLKNVDISLAYRSPLTRTKQTLEHILVYHPKTKTTIDPRITERDYGQLSRHNKSIYAKTHPVLYPIYHRSYDVAPPEGESILEVEVRVLDFIEDLLKMVQKENSNALIVGHANSMRPLRRFFENLSIPEMMKLENHRDEVIEYSIDVEEEIHKMACIKKIYSL